MGVDDYRDSEGDAEERTGLGSGPDGIDSSLGEAMDDDRDPSGA